MSCQKVFRRTQYSRGTLRAVHMPYSQLRRPIIQQHQYLDNSYLNNTDEESPLRCGINSKITNKN